jgi:hypothetical protein
MAILGRITVEELLILTVDVSPISSGVPAPIGSLALLDDDTNGNMWIKTGGTDTAWTPMVRLPTGVTGLTNNQFTFGDANGFLQQTPRALWDGAGRFAFGLNAPAAPQSTIHLDRGTAVGTHVRMTAGTTTGVTAGDGTEFGIDDTGAAEIKQYENSNINFYTNNTFRGAWANTGQLLIGTATPIDITGLSAFPTLQFVGTSAVQMVGIQYSADTIGPVFNQLKSRGATVGTQGLVLQDDEFGRFQFRGSDGVNFQAGASIRALVDGVAAAGSMPGRLILMTTPTGATTPVERMRISQNGNVRVLDLLQLKRRAVDFTSQATANTTTTLTSASNGVQIFTGTTAGQIVRLPDATTLIVGAQYEIFNNSTATVALQDNSGGALEVLSTVTGYAVAILTDNSTAAGVWSARSSFEATTTRVASTTLISTTSATDTLMTGMTITPAAGTYQVSVRAEVSATTNNRNVTVSVYSGGSKVADSEVVSFIRTGNGLFTSADIQNTTTDAIVTVNGSQAIETRWRTSGGTAQAQGYALIVKKLNN